MDSRLERTIGAALIALLAGAASFFVWSYTLVGIGIWTRLIPWAIFGPQPKEFAWVMLSIYGSGIFVAGTVAWRVFRLFAKSPSNKMTRSQLRQLNG